MTQIPSGGFRPVSGVNVNPQTQTENVQTPINIPNLSTKGGFRSQFIEIMGGVNIDRINSDMSLLFTEKSREQNSLQKQSRTNPNQRVQNELQNVLTEMKVLSEVGNNLENAKKMSGSNLLPGMTVREAQFEAWMGLIRKTDPKLAIEILDEARKNRNIESNSLEKKITRRRSDGNNVARGQLKLLEDLKRVYASELKAISAELRTLTSGGEIGGLVGNYIKNGRFPDNERESRDQVLRDVFKNKSNLVPLFKEQLLSNLSKLQKSLRSELEAIENDGNLKIDERSVGRHATLLARLGEVTNEIEYLNELFSKNELSRKTIKKLDIDVIKRGIERLDDLASDLVKRKTEFGRCLEQVRKLGPDLGTPLLKNMQEKRDHEAKIIDQQLSMMELRIKPNDQSAKNVYYDMVKMMSDQEFAARTEGIEIENILLNWQENNMNTNGRASLYKAPFGRLLPAKRDRVASPLSGAFADTVDCLVRKGGR